MFDLLICVPFADPVGETLQRISAEWNVPVIDSTEISLILFGPDEEPEGGYAIPSDTGPGIPGVLIDRLSVLPQLGDRPEDRDLARRVFGLDINLIIGLNDERHGTQNGSLRWLIDAFGVALHLAAIKGTHAVMIEGYQADDIVLSFDQGQVTMNRDWHGWQRWPELLDVIPRPHRMESLLGDAANHPWLGRW